MARKKLNLKDSLKDIIKRQQEAQELFEKGGKREQLFRSDEERESDEARVSSDQSYRWEDGEGESKEDESEETSTPSLPPPELIYPITQSTVSFEGPYGVVGRKDRYGVFHKQAASKQSTRVSAAQWIPTFDVDPDEQGNQTYSGYGDILVGFARPSASQSSGFGALYVWMTVEESIWEAFKNTDSFGIYVENLGKGEKLPPDRIRVYLEEHSSYDDMGEGAEDTARWIWTIGFTTNRDGAEQEAIRASHKAIIEARAAERKRTTKGKKTKE